MKYKTFIKEGYFDRRISRNVKTKLETRREFYIATTFKFCKKEFESIAQENLKGY